MLRKSKIYLINSNIDGIISIGESKPIFRNFSSEDYLDEIVKDFGDTWTQKNLFNKVVNIPTEYRAEIDSLFDSIIEEKDKDDFLSPGLIKMYFQTAILKILRYHKETNENLVRKENLVADATIQQAANYINSNFDKDITLDKVAQIVHLNASYFSKKFKTVTGIGFKEYLTNIRIVHSERLLLETHKSITEIAFQCGFDNSNYFGDAFKHRNSVSPSEFRKLKGNLT